MITSQVLPGGVIPGRGLVVAQLVLGEYRVHEVFHRRVGLFFCVSDFSCQNMDEVRGSRQRRKPIRHKERHREPDFEDD